MSAPTRGSLTNRNQLEINWQFLTTYEQRGGSVIDSYELQVDDGASGAFMEVIGYTEPYTLNSLLIDDNIQSGLTYRVRYRAHNVHGWSDFSPTLLILAATVPGPTGEPQSEIEGTDLKMTWSEPIETGGAGVTITSYRVDLLLKTSEFATICTTAEVFCLLP